MQCKTLDQGQTIAPMLLSCHAVVVGKSNSPNVTWLGISSLLAGSAMSSQSLSSKWRVSYSDDQAHYHLCGIDAVKSCTLVLAVHRHTTDVSFTRLFFLKDVVTFQPGNDTGQQECVCCSVSVSRCLIACRRHMYTKLPTCSPSKSVVSTIPQSQAITAHAGNTCILNQRPLHLPECNFCDVSVSWCHGACRQHLYIAPMTPLRS